MQHSFVSPTMTRITNNLTYVKPRTAQRPESIKTNSSKMSQATISLSKTSINLEQRLKKLKAGVKNLKLAHQEGEKRRTVPPPYVFEEPRDEGNYSIDIEVNNPDDVKKAKREARRAKWAAMRASLKQITKKAGKAVALSGAFILGFICGPILVVVDLAFLVVGIVIRVIMELVGLVGLICIPFYVCFTS